MINSPFNKARKILDLNLTKGTLTMKKVMKRFLKRISKAFQKKLRIKKELQIEGFKV